VEIPYVDLASQYNQHREEILAAVDEVLKSGQYILGPQVELFEKNMANLCGVRHAIAVADGTESLMLTMKVMGIGPGDEVITAPNSWISSASSITHVGAKPVFVDVSSDQNINPALIEKAITKNTKAIMPVHLTGKMADMKTIMEVAKKHNLFVIEDAAQAVGAKYRGQAAGAIGHAGSFSLHPLKNLNAAGDAGLITTNDDRLAEEIKLLRNHGIVDRENINKWGYNSRLDSIQASILNVRLKYLEQVTARRRRNAELYRKLLTTELQCPQDADGCFDVYHLFVIQTARRNELKAYLQTKGITTAIHYPVPIHLYKAAEELGYKRGDFPVCEKQAGEILSLPIHQGLSDKHIEYIANEINQFMRKS
jgi:dTDP-4-amino-4,6-dideoxygalactose transaminase